MNSIRYTTGRFPRWGLLDKVLASNCPPVCSIRVDFGSFSLTGYPPPLSGVDTAYDPRRIVLDKILVDARLKAGTELREEFTTNEVLLEDGRVSGIRGRTRNGTNVTEKVRFVVGADSLHSLVARGQGAEIIAISCSRST